MERDNGRKIRKMVLQDLSSQLAPKDLILMERRNQKQVGDDITGHGHWLKHMRRVGILAGVYNRGCGEQD